MSHEQEGKIHVIENSTSSPSEHSTNLNVLNSPQCNHLLSYKRTYEKRNYETFRK